MPDHTKMIVLPGRSRPLRAVLFDVDGTLYHQPSLRCFMALELCTLLWAQRSWHTARMALKALRTFRHVREELRKLGEAKRALEVLQYQEALNCLKGQRVPEETLRDLVQEWLIRRPLKYLPLCRRRGIESFLLFLVDCGISLGVFSDYPVEEKLQALSLTQYFSVKLCSTDIAINAFKPHPKGFLYACKIFGDLSPEEVLYIGDRFEIDAIGAKKSGMPCAIFAKQSHKKTISIQNNYLTFSSFYELQHVFHYYQ